MDFKCTNHVLRIGENVSGSINDELFQNGVAYGNYVVPIALIYNFDQSEERSTLAYINIDELKKMAAKVLEVFQE